MREGEGVYGTIGRNAGRAFAELTLSFVDGFTQEIMDTNERDGKVRVRYADFFLQLAGEAASKVFEKIYTLDVCEAGSYHASSPMENKERRYCPKVK